MIVFYNLCACFVGVIWSVCESSEVVLGSKGQCIQCSHNSHNLLGSLVDLPQMLLYRLLMNVFM